MRVVIKLHSSENVIFFSFLQIILSAVVVNSLDDLIMYQTGGKISNGAVRNFDSLLQEASTEPPLVEEPIMYTDKLLYIFTSGTTGLPKAAILPHSRYALFNSYKFWDQEVGTFLS